MEMNYFNCSSTKTQMDLMSTVMMEMDKLSELPQHQTPTEAAPPGVYSGGVSQEFCNAAAASSPTSVGAMREMIFRMAAMQPIRIDPEWVKPPKRRNVRISKDPQSVAARHRRERISERIRILQQLVPGGTKMDTASMLDEAIHYMKFLKSQVQSLERAAAVDRSAAGFSAMAGAGLLHGSESYSCFDRGYEWHDNGFVVNNFSDVC